jgi:hypothetical protein
MFLDSFVSRGLAVSKTCITSRRSGCAIKEGIGELIDSLVGVILLTWMGPLVKDVINGGFMRGGVLGGWKQSKSRESV